MQEIHQDHVHIKADPPKKDQLKVSPNRKEMRRNKLLISSHTGKGFIRKSGRKLAPASLYTHFIQQWTNAKGEKKTMRLPRTLLLKDGTK